MHSVPLRKNPTESTRKKEFANSQAIGPSRSEFFMPSPFLSVFPKDHLHSSPCWHSPKKGPGNVAPLKFDLSCSNQKIKSGYSEIFVWKPSASHEMITVPFVSPFFCFFFYQLRFTWIKIVIVSLAK